MEKIAQEHLDELAKKHGVGSIEIQESTEEVVHDPIAKIPATFRLYEKDYPALERATIVISEEKDECWVAVKAIGQLPDGSRSWFGDLCCVNKNESIDKLFDALQSVFKNVEAMINSPNKGDMA